MTFDAASAAVMLERLIESPASDRAHVLDGLEDRQVALSALVDCAEQVAMSDVSRADAATSAVMQLADDVGSQLERARARRARARALSFAGRFGEALQTCNEGMRLAVEAGSAIDAARARLASMHALGELGRLDEAIAAGERARQEFMESGEPSLAARADINIGVAWQRRDDPATAVACFERARPLVADQPMLLGPLENNRGEALLAMADFRGAEQAFTAALEAFQGGGSSIAAAIAEGNLADLAARQGRLQKAMAHFEHARRTLEHDDAPGHLARLLAEQADAMSMLGLPREALREYESALSELDRQGLKLEAARARTGMGLSLIRLQRHAQAETSLAAAATAFSELHNATARARVDLIRAEMAAKHGRVADAQRLALEALTMLHDRPVEAARAHHVLGQLAASLGRVDQAEAEFTLALSLARELDLAPLLADLLAARGELRASNDRLEGGIADLEAAVDQVERIRGTLLAERFRAAFSGDRSFMYFALVSALLDAASPVSIARAFAVTEKARSRVLLDQMCDMLREPDANHIHDRRSEDAGQQALLDELEIVRAEINALYSRLGDDGHGPQRPDWTPGEHWRQMVRERERRVDEIESRLATARSDHRGLAELYAATIDLPQAKQQLPDGHALVSYMVGRQETVAFVIGADSCEHVRLPVHAEQLSGRVQSLRFQIQRALRPGACGGSRGERLVSDARRELAMLGTILLEPVLPLIKSAQQMTIIPHDVLHLVPFSALVVGDQYLIERMPFNSVPSATVLAHLQRDRRQQRASPASNGSVVVVGVDDEFAPRIADEARGVASHFRDSTLITGEYATVDSVANAAAKASLVHLACHGRFAAESPSGSGLRLADRWMTMRDIYSMRLKADLVTLSGCETGVNLVKAGDELMGLVRGFLAAGASSVLASLWRVDDEATREFMDDVYGLWDRLLDTSRLLRDAQISAMRKRPHPAYWAPFVLIGTP